MSNEKKPEEVKHTEGPEVSHEDAQKHAQEVAEEQQKKAHEGDAKPDKPDTKAGAAHKK